MLQIIKPKNRITLLAALALFCISPLSNAVIFGQNAVEDEWPFMASIHSSSLSKHVCGATLIAPSVAMTAAHCVVGKDKYDMEIWVGPYRVRTGPSSSITHDASERFSVIDVREHPDFDISTWEYDVALLFLDGESSKQPIALPVAFDNFVPGPLLDIIGWGWNGSADITNPLQWAEMTRAGCGTNAINGNIQFCAGGDGGPTHCAGDSGGPAFRYVNDEFVQYGIVSGGSGGEVPYFSCGQPNIYGIYGKVAGFRDWIDAEVARGPTSQVTGDFETNLNGWTVTTGYQWLRDANGTPSNGTGPASGANGSDYYLYFETSSGYAYNSGNTARVESPEFDVQVGTEVSISFHYHMYGSNTGTLHLRVKDGGIWRTLWSRSGQQQNSSASEWTKAEVTYVPSGASVPAKIQFQAVAAGGYMGDIAIDDIAINGVALSQNPGNSGVPASPTLAAYACSQIYQGVWRARWNPVADATYYIVRLHGQGNASTNNTEYTNTATGCKWVQACNSAGCSPKTDF